MTTTLESTGPLERRLNLSIQMGAVSSQVEQRLKELARTVRLPGFRPGKVPLRMVQQSYGPQVHAEVLGDAVSKAFSEAVESHQLKIAGQPRIEPQASGQGETDGVMNFSATFEVYPNVTLGDPASLSVERATCEVGDDEIAKTIEILRKQRTTYTAVDRVAEEGDRVTLDFLGTLEGEAFPGGAATDFTFVLGEGRMLPDFESGVRGMGVGEARAVPVAFPGDYSAQALAGKTASFQLTVKKIEAPAVPALDEAFARALGVTDGSVETLRADVQRNLQREVGQRLRNRIKTAVMETLPRLAEFEVPRALVQGEAEQLKERARGDFKQRGMDIKDMPLPDEAFIEPATRRVRLGLIVGEIVKSAGLQAKPDQLRRQIEEFAQTYENPAEVIRWYFSDRERLAEVEALVVEQNVVDWFLAKAQVTDTTVAFDELMATA